MTYIDGNLTKFYAMNPYSRFSIEEEERLYKIFKNCWDDGGCRDRDVPDWFKYMHNREDIVDFMTIKTAKQQKKAQAIIQGEEMQAKLAGNKHLLDFIEKLNNEIKKEPEPNPQVIKVVTTEAKAKTTKAKPAAKVTKPKVTQTNNTKQVNYLEVLSWL